MTKRTMAMLLILAVVAAACGGRLSEDEMAAELSTDGGGSGFAGGGGGGDGISSGGDGFAGGDGLADGGSIDGGVDGVDGGGDGATGGPGSGGGDGSSDPSGGDGGGGTNPNSQPPSGGNGGATDVGVTATEIRIGNVSTIGGPVPGLFKGALVGTQARFAKANSEGGLFGRQFKVVSADDNFDAGTNRAKHKELVDQVFGFVGSFSLFDGSSVPELKSSGALDVGRALALERQALPTSFSPQPFQPGWPTTGCNYLKQKFGDKVKKMAIFWGNQEAARNNADWQRNACESVGFEFVYEREFQATENNFTADVIQMQQRDVQGFFVVFDVSGIARFFKSIHQQGFDPPIKFPSPAAYDGDFVKLAGADALEGTIIGQGMAMFLGADKQRVPEIGEFLEWMARVDPGQKIDLFALYGWLSAEMLLDRMEAVGPNVTRKGMVESFNKIGEWDNKGVTAPQDVAGESNAFCEMYLIVQGGQFKRESPANGFSCNGKFQPA